MRQRGQVYRSGASWKIRLYEADGRRRQIGGFDREKDAVAALERELRRVRRGVHAGDMTVEELLDEFEEQHAQYVEPETLERMRYQLRYPRRAFGTLRLDRLTPRAIVLWRAKLPAGTAHHILHTFKQTLAYAVRTKLLDENPAADVPNPEPKRQEIRPFTSWEELEGFAEELGDWGPLAMFAGATGLRPQEWLALERRDVKRAEGVLDVRRVLTRSRRVKEYGKTPGSTRRVPLSDRALAALDELTARVDTPLLFPRADGGYLNIEWWHREFWRPGIRAWQAGDPTRTNRRPYDLRHTYAAFAIAAGVHPFHLARFMGTSMEQIDKTYGHLLPDAEEQVRVLLNSWDAEQSERARARSGHDQESHG
jgi:integrase